MKKDRLKCLFFVFLGSILSSCASLRSALAPLPPKHEVMGVELKKLDDLNLDVAIQVRLENLNSYTVAVENLTYDLRDKDGVFAKGNYTHNVELPAGEKLIVVLPLKIDLRKSFLLLRKILLEKEDVTTTVDVAGDVTAGWFSTPIQMSAERKWIQSLKL